MRMDRPTNKFLFLAFILACIARIYRLDERGMWIDEITTIRSAHELQFLVSPHFLSHAFVRLMLHIGDSPLWVRLPSVLAGIAGVPAFAWMMMRWCGKTIAVPAAAWIALSPYHIFFSVQARYYSEVFLVAALALGLWPMLLPRPRPMPLLALLGLACVGYGVHPVLMVFFALLAGMAAILWLREWTRTRSVFSWQRMHFVWLAAILCLVAVMVKLMGGLAWQRLQTSNLAALLQGDPIMLPPRTGLEMRFLFFPFFQGATYDDNALSPLRWLMLLLAGLGFVRAWSDRRLLATLFLVIWLGTLAATVMYATKTPWDPKYGIYILPLYGALAVLGLDKLLSASARLIKTRLKSSRAVIAATILCLVQAPYAWKIMNGDFDGFYNGLRKVAELSEGPQVVCTTTQGFIILRYYKERQRDLDRLQVKMIRDWDDDCCPDKAEDILRGELAQGIRPWLITPSRFDTAVNLETVNRLEKFF